MAESNFRNIKIVGITSAIPKNKILIEQSQSALPAEELRKIKDVYGIGSIHRSVELQTTSDLGYLAANSLLEKCELNRDDIGIILFISTTPDYRSPATALVLQHRLGLSKDCVAYDINLGGAGFVYGLQLGCAILDSLNKSFALVICGDTSGKQLDSRSFESLIYGDACSAIVLKKEENAPPIFIKTKAAGEHFRAMIIESGAFRLNNSESEQMEINEAKIRSFIKAETPGMLEQLNGTIQDVNKYDVIVLPQVGAEVFNYLVKKIGIIPSKILSNFEKRGNVRGCSIPLLLTDKARSSDTIIKELRVLGCAFGEGFSWGVADFTVSESALVETLESDDFFGDGGVSHEV